MMRRNLGEFCHHHPEAYAIVHAFLFPPGLYSHLWLPPSPLPKSLPLVDLESFSSHCSVDLWIEGCSLQDQQMIPIDLGNGVKPVSPLDTKRKGTNSAVLPEPSWAEQGLTVWRQEGS